MFMLTLHAELCKMVFEFFTDVLMHLRLGMQTILQMLR